MTIGDRQTAPPAAPQSDREIAAIPAPITGETVIWFAEVAGLHLRIRPGGTKSWRIQFRIAGKRSVLALGQFPGLTRAGAIAAAKKQRTAIAGGVNPAAERRIARNKVLTSRAFDDYLSHIEGSRSAAYLVAQKHYLTKSLARLRSIPIDELDAATMARALDAIKGKTARNRAAAALSVALKFAAGRGVAPSAAPYVARAIPKGKERPRDRLLAYDELARLWAAAGAEKTNGGRIVLLLMLLGLRRAEVGDLQGHEVDREAKLLRLPPGRVKNRQGRLVALTDRAMALIPDGPGYLFGRNPMTGFSGWSRLWSRLEKAANVKDATMHDFRRALSSHLGEHREARRDIIEMLLGHVQPGVVGTYNVAQQVEMQREHLLLWQQLLEANGVFGKGATI